MLETLAPSAVCPRNLSALPPLPASVCCGPCGVDGEMNNRQIGDLSELMVLTEFVRLGRRVAIPYGNCTDFDLLVESDGQWLVADQRAKRRSLR